VTKFTECPPEILSIAWDLINRHHDHLREARIGFIFRDEAQQSKGRTVFVSVRKPPLWLEAFDASFEYDFIIEIAENIYAELKGERREALIDYALCHCGMGKNGWVIIAPDIEGYKGNVDRYGFWNSELLKAADTFRNAQMRLPNIEMGTRGNMKAVDPLAWEEMTHEAEGSAI